MNERFDGYGYGKAPQVLADGSLRRRADQGAEVRQTGWAFFDLQQGRPLLGLRAQDGQLLLVDRTGRAEPGSAGETVLWSFVVRQAGAVKYVSKVELEGSLTADGAASPEGHTRFLLECQAHRTAAPAPAPPLEPLKVLLAASRGEEFLDV